MAGIEWYPGRRARLDADVAMALEQAAEAVRTDLVASQTVPYAEDSPENRERGVVPGELQGSIFVDASGSARGSVAVVSDTPYARRLYYHPEYRFYRGANRRAGGEWYRPYLPGGEKARFALDAFRKRLRAIRGVC